MKKKDNAKKATATDFHPGCEKVKTMKVEN